MDRMSIGPFIAALRKARGLTQKELAAMLSVADKTVSRWETGDGTPELALIPVLAEQLRGVRVQLPFAVRDDGRLPPADDVE